MVAKFLSRDRKTTRRLESHVEALESARRLIRSLTNEAQHAGAVLSRVDRVIDLSWLREKVADCYYVDKRRPGIDRKAAIRLMLAGPLSGIVRDRRLMREARSTSPSVGSQVMAFHVPSLR